MTERGGHLTLVVLGKREVCGALSVQGYARSVHLTPAETRVLEKLCGGVRPSDIANDAGVAVSTVRTQIGSIRAKTGAASIRDLVRQVAVLPPLVGALRGAFAGRSS
jgi:DNA-binding CsgD family transcriptional regulator